MFLREKRKLVIEKIRGRDKRIEKLRAMKRLEKLVINKKICMLKHKENK